MTKQKFENLCWYFMYGVLILIIAGLCLTLGFKLIMWLALL